jgi:outer membrane protein TolC
VVTATANYLAEQRSAANVMQRRLTAAVALVRALGGGWDASQLSPRK